MFCRTCFNSRSCRKTPELLLWPPWWSPMLWDRNQKPQRFLNWRRSLAAKDLWSTDDPSPPGETTLIRSSDRLHLCSLISPQRHTKRKNTNTCIHTYTLTQTHTESVANTCTHMMTLFRLLHHYHVWSMIGPNSFNLEEIPLISFYLEALSC